MPMWRGNRCGGVVVLTGSARKASTAWESSFSRTCESGVGVVETWCQHTNSPSPTACASLLPCSRVSISRCSGRATQTISTLPGARSSRVLSTQSGLALSGWAVRGAPLLFGRWTCFKRHLQRGHRALRSEDAATSARHSLMKASQRALRGNEAAW